MIRPQRGNFLSDQTDDLASAVGDPHVSLFADDVAVWMQDTDLERTTSKLQKGDRCCNKLEYVMKNRAVSPIIGMFIPYHKLA